MEEFETGVFMKWLPPFTDDDGNCGAHLEASSFSIRGFDYRKMRVYVEGRQLDPHNNGAHRAGGKKSDVNFIDKLKKAPV